MKRKVLIGLSLAVVFWAVVNGSLSADQATSKPGATSKPKPRVVKFKYLKIDLDKREIIIDAEVNLREGSLEFLLCKWVTAVGQKSKEHESILRTKAAASQLHGALLLLGLAPGKPAQWVVGDDDVEGRFLPPRGAKLNISLRWRDKKGKVRVIEASKFITVAEKKKAAVPKEWIFVGSDILGDGRYWADTEGGIISVANTADAVIDVPFESSSKNLLLSFIANTQAIPEKGTAVEVIIRPQKDAEKAPHARATLVIDSVGDFYLDGTKVPPGKLSQLAQKFVMRHSKGEVAIVARPAAQAADIVQARDQLYIGGVLFVSHKWLSYRQRILPRSKDQLDAEMKLWAKKFATPRDYIQEPSQEARDTLKRIESQTNQLKARLQILNGYSEKLQKAMAEYEPTTRPSRIKQK